MNYKTKYLKQLVRKTIVEHTTKNKPKGNFRGIFKNLVTEVASAVNEYAFDEGNGNIRGTSEAKEIVVDKPGSSESEELKVAKQLRGLADKLINMHSSKVIDDEMHS
jgi:hypothetical protein